MSAQFSRKKMSGKCCACDAEQHQRGQALRIGLHVADVDAFARELLAHEAAHVLVADARQHRGAQAQAREADGDVGGGAAEILGEALHVLEAAADLLPVQIDRGATEADQVERLSRPSSSLAGPPERRPGCMVHACSSVNSGTV